MKVEEFIAYAGTSTTITGNSNPIFIGKRKYDGVPYTIQIHGGSSPVGVIQGVLAKDGDTTSAADASTKWQDMTNGTISGDGLFHLYAPVTYIRISLSGGNCKADIQF